MDNSSDYSLQDKIANMISHYKEICDREPNNHKARVDFGVFYTQLGNHQEAIELFKKALLINNNDYSIHRLLGISYTKINNYYNAITYLEKACELENNDYISLN